MMTPILQSLMRKLTPTQLQPTPIEEIYPCLVGQRERNEKRMAKIKADMGELYILHPKHKVKRLKKARQA